MKITKSSNVGMHISRKWLASELDELPQPDGPNWTFKFGIDTCLAQNCNGISDIF